MEALWREKDLELERFRAGATQREGDERIAAQRRLRQSTEEAMYDENLTVFRA